MNFHISVADLRERLDHVVVIDTRFDLFDPAKGAQLYQESHIPGAIYFDLNKDLAAPAQQHGGNHPLPDETIFLEKLGQAGVDRDTTVVIYDQDNDMFSARLKWLLDYYQHPSSYILEDGFSAWVKDGYPTTHTVSYPEVKTYVAEKNTDEIIEIKALKSRMEDPSSLLIDARSRVRYLGKEEPLYDKAGHIPSAKNFDWQSVRTDTGQWKSLEALTEHFSELKEADEIVVSCGSGVSACVNVLALKAIGFTNVKLYPGSYSDWISYSDNIIETKEE